MNDSNKFLVRTNYVKIRKQFFVSPDIDPMLRFSVLVPVKEQSRMNREAFWPMRTYAQK